MRLSIACSARFGSNARRLGKSGSVDSVTAAAVAEVRAAGALRQQALQLVRAKRSMVSRVDGVQCSEVLGAVTDEVFSDCKPTNVLRERLAKAELVLLVSYSR